MSTNHSDEHPQTHDFLFELELAVGHVEVITDLLIDVETDAPGNNAKRSTLHVALETHVARLRQLVDAEGNRPIAP
jgi:hypothetical protein